MLKSLFFSTGIDLIFIDVQLSPPYTAVTARNIFAADFAGYLIFSGCLIFSLLRAVCIIT